MTNDGFHMASIRSTPADVARFLRDHSVPDVIIKQFELHTIDGLSFSLLTEQDLREMHVPSIHQRKHLLLLSASWRRLIDRKSTAQYSAVLDFINDTSYDPVWRRYSECLFPNNTFLPRFRFGEPNVQVAFGDSSTLLTALDECNSDGSSTSSFESSQQLWKVFLSACYAFLVAGIASFIMVIAHERLPDISTYPPLPDLLLDNLPHITWAFKAAEWVGVVLTVIWIAIVFFHQYRWILLRRFFALIGTVFLLRSITMLITSLSVPGRHLAEHCAPYHFVNHTDRFRRVFDIWFGLGMSIRNIRTCGDYMFSGHTTVLTLLNFFITEYAPRKFQLLHTFSWILNTFGVFFIIASHEHYSIDVFVAIYVSSRLFLYYHCLANNRILHQEDKARAMIWFPLFSLLEYDVDGIVPNTYEIPFLSHRLFRSANVQLDGRVPYPKFPTPADPEQHPFSLHTDCPDPSDKLTHKKEL